MQPDTITLAIDELNNATLVNKVFTRFDEYQNRSVYNSADHTIVAKDTLSLYRTPPKTSGNFRGTAKTAVKFSKDLVVLGVDGSNLNAPIILEVSFSIPVGATTAQMLSLRQRVIALLDRDDIMVPLNHLQMI